LLERHGHRPTLPQGNIPQGNSDHVRVGAFFWCEVVQGKEKKRKGTPVGVA
jgi:hypothetical protein